MLEAHHPKNLLNSQHFVVELTDDIRLDRHVYPSLWYFALPRRPIFRCRKVLFFDVET